MVAGTALLIWAGSGLLHPVMSWTNPRAAAMAPPLEAPLTTPAVALADAARRQGATTIGYARLVSQEGETLWQWTPPDRLHWFYASAADGAPRPQADARRAELLARHYSGEAAAAVLSAERIDAFDVAYPAVNRLLPVWRVRFDRPDQLTAYVHTGEDRLASLNDRRKTVLLMLFQTLHTWHWLDGVEGVRLSLIGLAILSVLAMAMLGGALVLLRRQGPMGTRTRRVHRLLAWGVWGPALMLGVSGLFHLGMQTSLRRSPPATPPGITLTALPVLAEAPQRMSLLVLPEGQGVWRIQHQDQSRWVDAREGTELALDDAAMAARLAGLPPGTPAEQQMRFSAEYGFANRRLPVWRLEDGSNRVFVDLASGQLAGRAGALDVLEQRSFSTLHKWEFLSPIGRGPRDALLALAATLLVLTSVIGWRLGRRRGRAL